MEMDLEHVDDELQTLKSCYPKSYLILYKSEFRILEDLIKMKAKGLNVPLDKILNAFNKIGDPPSARRTSKYLNAKSKLTSEIFYHKTLEKKPNDSRSDESQTEHPDSECEEETHTESADYVIAAQHAPDNEIWPACDIDKSHGPSEWKCLHCEDHMCTSCTEIHRKGKRTREHRLLHRDEKSNESDILRGIFCSIHPGMELDRYCKDDEKSICVECFVKSHSKHNVITMDVMANETRSLVGKSLVTVDRAIPKYADLIQSLEEIISKAENQCRENCIIIASITESVISRIKTKSAEMKAEEEQYLKSIKETIATKTEDLKNMKQEMEKVALASRRFLETCNNRTLKNEAAEFIKQLSFEQPDCNIEDFEDISTEVIPREAEKKLLSLSLIW